jgi:hypothetical protein
MCVPMLAILVFLNYLYLLFKAANPRGMRMFSARVGSKLSQSRQELLCFILHAMLVWWGIVGVELSDWVSQGHPVGCVYTNDCHFSFLSLSPIIVERMRQMGYKLSVFIDGVNRDRNALGVFTACGYLFSLAWHSFLL